MDKIYTIETQGGITIIRFSKTPKIGDFRVIIDYLSEHNLYERRLWDFDLHGLDLTADEIEDIALYGKLKFSKPSKLAIVASRDRPFGLSRAFAVYREEDLVKIKVCRTEKEARRWLLE